MWGGALLQSALHQVASKPHRESLPQSRPGEGQAEGSEIKLRSFQWLALRGACHQSRHVPFIVCRSIRLTGVGGGGRQSKGTWCWVCRDEGGGEHLPGGVPRDAGTVERVRGRPCANECISIM
jgi:hypothetical protein